MDAIRQFIDVKGRSFRVILPDNFNAQRVEVIILPSIENDFELSDKSKKMLDERLEAYQKNPKVVHDFDQLLTKLDNEILGCLYHFCQRRFKKCYCLL